MKDSRDELLTVAEVARRLGVTPHTVYRWIAQGRLPAARISRKVIRVRKTDLDAFSAPGVGRIGEPRVSYRPGSQLSKAVLQRERERVRRLLEKYRKMVSRPRSPDEPRPGSREALLRVVGLISHEDAEELRRVIREAKTYSPPVEF